MPKSNKKIAARKKVILAAEPDENNVDPNAVHAPESSQAPLKKHEEKVNPFEAPLPARPVEEVRDPTLGLSDPLRYVVSAPDVIEKAEGLYELLREARPDLETHIEDAVEALDRLEKAAMGDAYRGHEDSEGGSPEGPDGEPAKKFESGAKVNVDMEDGQYKGVVDAVMPDGTYRVRTTDGLTLTAVPGYAMTEQTTTNNEHLALPVAASSRGRFEVNQLKEGGPWYVLEIGPQNKLTPIYGPYDNEEDAELKLEHMFVSSEDPKMTRKEKQGLQAGIIAASKKLVAEQLGDGSIVDGYLVTMLWAETWTPDYDKDPNDVHNLDDDFSLADVSEAARKKAIRDCASFEEKARAAGIDLSEFEADTVGHDFWLTRNGHGAGFWDGDYEKEIGDKLTKIAKSFGEENPEVGGDNKVHFMGEGKSKKPVEPKEEKPGVDVEAAKKNALEAFRVYVDGDDLRAEDGARLRDATPDEILEATNNGFSDAGWVKVPDDVVDMLYVGDDGVTRKIRKSKEDPKMTRKEKLEAAKKKVTICAAKNEYIIYSSHLSDNADDDTHAAADRIANHLQRLFPTVDVKVLHGVEGAGSGYHGNDVEEGERMDEAFEAFDCWSDVKASVFDEVEEIEIGEGYVVKKLKEKGKSRILVVKDGEDGPSYPDAFGDDKKAVIDFFKQLLGVKDKKDAKKDDGKKDKPKKSEPKLEDKPKELPFVKKKEKVAKTDDKPVDENAAKAAELFSNRLGVTQQILMARKKLGHLEVKQEDIDSIPLAGKGKVSLSAAMDAAMTAVVEREQLALMRLDDAELKVAADAVRHLRPKALGQEVKASVGTLNLMNLGVNAPRKPPSMSSALSSAGIAAFGL